jgi:preprotein translocase subunit SecE
MTSKKIVIAFFQVLGIVAIFDWIVFPLLTASDTLGNILGLIVGFLTAVFAVFTFGIDKLFKKDLES